MTENKNIFIENLFKASGISGIKKDQLYGCFQNVNDVDINSLIYIISKAFENYGNRWLNSTYNFLEEKEESWTEWHHIDEPHSDSWGFMKEQTGCYIYGLFEIVPEGKANYLDDHVFYIGESRSTIRSAMIGRRNDFRSTVKNNPIAPYSMGVAFKKYFGKEKIKYVYQAYYPLPAYKCKEKEIEFLVDYFNKYQNLPICNHKRNYKKIYLLSKNYNIDMENK